MCESSDFQIKGIPNQKAKFTQPLRQKYIFLPLQSVVRFLWDAHNCEDSPADAEVQLGVSFAYVERWNDLEQLWFLGMQILNSLMKPVSEVDILINSSQICKLSYVKHEFN